MKVLFFILILVFSKTVLSQDALWKININDKDVSTNKLFKGVTVQNYKQKLSEVLQLKIEDGFLEASIDSISKDDSLKLLQIAFYEGERYKWAKLEVENKDFQLLSKYGYGEKLFTNQPFSPKEIGGLYEDVISHLENNGYPFARIKLENVGLENELISAKLNLQKGPLISIDSVYIKTTDKVSLQTVYNAININPGDLYSELKLKEISTRIKEIPYLKENKSVDVEFVNEKCNVYVYLNTVKSNNFNGVLGVQPNQNGDISITGDVKVKLLNSFYRGEFIGFNWRQTQQLTQDLDLEFNYPFLFNTSFGIDSKLNIYKRDTTFVDADLRFGIDYIFSGANKITAFIERKNSSLLSTAQYQNITVLPDYADVTKNNYGLELALQTLDYRFNPRKGVDLSLLSSVGFKKIKRNQSLPEEVYNEIDLNTFLYRLEGSFKYFMPIKKKATVMVRLKGASFYNEQIFTNELFRVGGIQTIRGFDEESIFASSYLIGTLEYRFLLEQNSNIYLFYDYGLLEKNLKSSYDNDQPFSFGAGISFQTKPGVFSLSYALGSQLNSPIYLRTAKVHFGFISFF